MCRKSIIAVLIVLTIWLVKGTDSGSYSYCPEDLLGEVFSCLHNLTHGSDRSMLIAGGDAMEMKKHCISGSFNDSVECLQKLYKQCPSPKDNQQLQKLADPIAWRSGFGRFCTHLDLYLERRQCIKQQNHAVESCVSKNEDVFKNDITSAEVKYETIEVQQEEHLKKTCRFFHWIYQCLNSPLGSKCGPEIGAILSDFIGGIKPPACRGFRINNSSRRTNFDISVILTFLALTFIFTSYL